MPERCGSAPAAGVFGIAGALPDFYGMDARVALRLPVHDEEEEAT